MFEHLKWQPDRLVLNDYVFRLEHYRNDNWELGEECFRFYKIKELVDEYEQFLGRQNGFRSDTILEIGIWDGGSAAFWYETLKPEKLVAIDISDRGDSAYFKRYVQSKNVGNRLKTYWGTDQSDAQKLTSIVTQEFGAPLDVVIDDGSHLYGPTKSSFEVLFPLVRPGGFYIIEDWAWAHWPEFQTPNHEWANEKALTQLVFDLVEVVGSSTDVIANISVLHGFCSIERGISSQEHLSTLRLEHFIRRRPPLQLSARKRLRRQLERHVLWRFR